MYAKYDDFVKFEEIIKHTFWGGMVGGEVKPHFVITVENAIKFSLHYVIKPQVVIMCCIL